MLDIPALETQTVTSPRTRKRPALGIIGGGQLALMTAQSALSLGCDVVILYTEAAPASE